MANVTTYIEDTASVDTRTELDSHANMMVLGSNAFIFELTGRSCNVQPFDSKLGMSHDVPIVDGALAYECPYTMETYVPIVRNALYIKHLRNNLFPPFIMREGGVVVNDVPKIHSKHPTVTDHSTSFPDEPDLLIPLHLSGIFSYFCTRKPEEKELFNCTKLFLTPDSSDWNPHCTSFETNERSMLNFKGEISEKDRWLKDPQIFDNNEEVPTLSSVTVDQWNEQIDYNISSTYIGDETYIIEDDFAKAINLRGELSCFGTSIGSTVKSESNELFSSDTPMILDWDDFEVSLRSELNPVQISFVESKIKAAEAARSRGVSPSALAKLWLVKEDLAQGAIAHNTQLCRHNAENHLSKR